MSGIWPWLFRSDRPKQPYVCHVSYRDGSTAKIDLWADTDREAVSLILSLLPFAKPVQRLQLEPREES